MNDFSRRRVLRGMLGGSAITVGLPLLNCFLNNNGDALASGQPIPTRFGTWFWGLGCDSSIFVPKTTGSNYDLPEEIAALEQIKNHINVFTGFSALRDTYQNICHYTGWVISRTGQAPSGSSDRPGETIDVSVSNLIGRTTRFKSLTATATGDPRTSYSWESANSINTSESSPVNFYTRLFGPDFQDPNSPTFTPNPRVMIRKSALSSVMQETKELEAKVGAEDKIRLEQYFTGLRHIEHQLEQQLTKPEPIAACKIPQGVKVDPKQGVETAQVALRHKLMTDLLVMAIACDQTRVFNMSYSNAAANTSKLGYEKPHHTTTHEEPVDNQLGYQPTASWFLRRSMESWVDFVQAFANFKEGDGTLLDHSLIYATTDHGYARIHSLDNIPAFTAGRASGKVKTGLHVAANNTPITRLGLTSMKVMGLENQTWGTHSNSTSNIISEILV